MKKIFSFDAETNGLWGQPFAIGAIVYNENGAEVARFVGRLPDEVVTDSWWLSADEGQAETRFAKVAKAMAVSHQSYEALLEDFATFYLKYYVVFKSDTDVIVHMGVPVEAGLLRDMHSRKLIGPWDGPYPLLDVAGMLVMAHQDPTSVDKYADRHMLAIGEFEGGTHNPLYDAQVAAVVYRHLMENR